MGDTFNSVWDALFDDPAELAVNKVKAKLMDKVRAYIKQNKLTQQQAAEKMGITQPRVSDISMGKISKFTIDALIGLLAKVEVKTEIRFPNKKLIQTDKVALPWLGFRVIAGKKKKKPAKLIDYGASIPCTAGPNGVDDEYTNQA